MSDVSKRELIVGNWKMNGSLELVRAMANEMRSASPELRCDLVLCPPSTLVFEVARALAGLRVGVGGQDCHPDSKGPHTGDVSAAMLREAGAAWVILGHSERRSAHGETDALVRRKAVTAAAAGLTPIICVGETEAERDSGRSHEAIDAQLRGSVPDDFMGVVAYEPIWAIGTNRSARPQDIAETHAFIRARLQDICRARGDRDTSILYGGSVNVSNASEILATSDVDGVLVGGASLSPKEFAAIAKAGD